MTKPKPAIVYAIRFYRTDWPNNRYMRLPTTYDDIQIAKDMADMIAPTIPNYSHYEIWNNLGTRVHPPTNHAYDKP